MNCVKHMPVGLAAIFMAAGALPASAQTSAQIAAQSSATSVADINSETAEKISGCFSSIAHLTVKPIDKDGFEISGSGAEKDVTCNFSMQGKIAANDVILGEMKGVAQKTDENYSVVVNGEDGVYTIDGHDTDGTRMKVILHSPKGGTPIGEEIFYPTQKITAEYQKDLDELVQTGKATVTQEGDLTHIVIPDGEEPEEVTEQIQSILMGMAVIGVKIELSLDSDSVKVLEDVIKRNVVSTPAASPAP